MPGTTDETKTATAVEEPVDFEGDELRLFEPAHEEVSEDTAEPIPLWKKVVAGAGLLAGVLVLVLLFESVSSNQDEPVSGIPLSLIEAEPEPPPPDTLRIRFDEVRERWNALEQAPLISTPLRRFSEPGELDSFLHRFDASTQVVGAYQDDGEWMVALMFQSDLRQAVASQMYLHMCHTLHPFSPDCIEAYQDTGLGGLPFAEHTATDSETSWQFEGNTWRMTVANGEITIRVLAPTSE